MYRNCIFCSADLGTNDAIEHFPVGRSLAFDAARGRLWAVCPRCARWNLAPLEERWEAIDEAERRFRDARVRAHRENIGLTRLRDGTRLVRVGDALPAEQAVWRYGDVFARRAWRYDLPRSVSHAAARAMRSTVAGGLVPVMGFILSESLRQQLNAVGGRRVMHRMPPVGGRELVLIRRWHLETATLAPDGEGGVEMHFPYGLGTTAEGQAAGRLKPRGDAVVIGGDAGRILLAKAVTVVNRAGARRGAVMDALGLLHGFRAPDAFVRWVADERMPLSKGGFVRLDRLDDTAVLNSRGALALEMAVHEEQERRAMEGELAGLAEMWRQAEAIAAIADRLPDDPPPADRRDPADIGSVHEGRFMYHNCMFCSADLKANDVLEHFPVGRSVAFDAAGDGSGPCARGARAGTWRRWRSGTRPLSRRSVSFATRPRACSARTSAWRSCATARGWCAWAAPSPASWPCGATARRWSGGAGVIS